MSLIHTTKLRKIIVTSSIIWFLIFYFSRSGDDQEEQIYVWKNLEKGAYSEGYIV